MLTVRESYPGGKQNEREPTGTKASRERAWELADKCTLEAAVNGITVDDIGPEWGTVEAIIYETKQYGMKAELEFWKAVAALRDYLESD